MLGIVCGMRSRWCSSTLCFPRHRGARLRNWHSVSVLILYEGRVCGLLMDTRTVFEGDQEAFGHSEVGTLRERGETETYGTMGDSPRRPLRGE